MAASCSGIPKEPYDAAAVPHEAVKSVALSGLKLPPLTQRLRQGSVTITTTTCIVALAPALAPNY